MKRTFLFLACSAGVLAAASCGSLGDSGGSGGRTGGSSTGGSVGASGAGGSGGQITGGTSSGGAGGGSTTSGMGGAGNVTTTGGSAGAPTGGSGGIATGGTAGSGAAGGTAGSGVAGGSGGAAGSGATGGSGGRGGTAGTAGTAGSGGSGGGPSSCPAQCISTPKSGAGCEPCFSFFVTSLQAMRTLSGNQNGFGGDLRFQKADGLSGADEICRRTAEMAMAGAGQKTWRAFLSVTKGPDGNPVHAKDRIGAGPWYDRRGRLVAANLANVIGADRPIGADPAIRDDLPNENGVPNHTDCANCADINQCCDNHDVLTATGPDGKLCLPSTGGGGGPGGRGCNGTTPSTDITCNDWTSSAPSGMPWCGHSWPRQGSGVNWMAALNEGGCAPGVNLIEMGGPREMTVGSGGGYGGIYCFAVQP